MVRRLYRMRGMTRDPGSEAYLVPRHVSFGSTRAGATKLLDKILNIWINRLVGLSVEPSETDEYLPRYLLKTMHDGRLVEVGDFWIEIIPVVAKKEERGEEKNKEANKTKEEEKGDKRRQRNKQRKRRLRRGRQMSMGTTA